MTDQGFADLVGLALSETGAASSRMIDVLEKYGQDTGEPSESPFSLYNNTNETLFGVLAGDTERARRFGGAMRFLTSDSSWDLQHLHAAIDWAPLDRPGAVIVDVGGGFGQVSQYLAQQTKHARFVVQDLEHNVGPARAALPEELKGRVGFVAHDFFAPQDPHGSRPAAFLFRWVMHNWGDANCAKILNGLIPAMRRGSKVLIYEYLLEDGPVKKSSGRLGLQMDMISATALNARERSARDFERLLRDAHESFVFEGVKKPAGSAMSLVEATWIGQ